MNNSTRGFWFHISWKHIRSSPGLCFPMFFCFHALELCTFSLGTCILPSLCDPVFPPPWVGCDPASLQLLHATNSHPGVIQRVHFWLLYALCPFLKFSPTPRGHRSIHQTEAVDKNSKWYTGHLKIEGWCLFSFRWHWFVGRILETLALRSNVYRKQERVTCVFCSQKMGLDDVEDFFLTCNPIPLRKCQRAGERVWAPWTNK